DGYLRTADNQTPHGGSEALPPQKLDMYPSLRTLYAGYAFSVDFRKARGHAYMLSDQDQSERVKQFPQYGACLHCHASVLPTYRPAGKQAGVPDDHPKGQVMKGFEQVCSMTLPEARKTVTPPVTCLDCHDPQSLALRVTRPGFLNGIREFAKSDVPAPHLPS